MAYTSTKSAGAGATAGATQVWGTPGEIVTSDNVYAECNGDSTELSQTLTASAFGFTLPANALVVGIQVDIERKRGGNPITDNSIRLVKAGTPVGDNATRDEIWLFTEGTITFGGATDLWGTTWTYGDINNAGFGVALVVNMVDLGYPSVDHIQITVTYTLSGETIDVPTAAITLAAPTPAIMVGGVVVPSGLGVPTLSAAATYGLTATAALLYGLVVTDALAYGLTIGDAYAT